MQVHQRPFLSGEPQFHQERSVRKVNIRMGSQWVLLVARDSHDGLRTLTTYQN